MRAWHVGALLLLALTGSASADGTPLLQDCLNPQGMREVVQGGGVVAPAAALKAAQQAGPKGDVVRAHLCRREDGFVYVIVTLRKDGRFAYVTVDAASGKVAGIQ